MVIFKEKTKCDYCLQEIFAKDSFKINLRLPYETNTMRHKHRFEDKITTVCESCKGYLLGHFRYAKGIK